MAINSKPIDYKQAVKLLESQEDHFLDFKAKEIAPKRITKSIAAFANADGGDLYIGLDENKEDAYGFIQICEKLFPLGQDFSYEFLSFSNNGYVLHVEIHKTRDIKRASDRIVYIRRGAQNIPLKSDEEINRLKMNKGLISYESQTISNSISIITESENIINFLTEVIPTASDTEIWLRKQQLIYEYVEFYYLLTRLKQ
mgnify:CR=1 FL=1